MIYLGDIMNKKKAQLVLERIAEGVWCQYDAEFYAYHQCAFCCVSPESEHDDHCPVKIAKEILDEMD